jgi:hypothetical protein
MAAAVEFYLARSAVSSDDDDEGGYLGENELEKNPSWNNLGAKHPERASVSDF